ncbi:MAG TPA: bifunctional phosphopantothenoylcysteine decarboxylase/phosphopantothenate--cysteine ligase CoaBC, partial [Solirubrobacterales bacterium]|nr:bifunctional phosphopantothenoylcysteine decarboxylase/phosphopantothenate--cysteine ligase CoaBC [Solirubrobacterales bacterium]
LVAPAMNERMYLSGATQGNLSRLRQMGVEVIDPGVGRLASKGEAGVGRLPEPTELLERVEAALDEEKSADLEGLRVLVTAGGTREGIDPVRYIGNRSSGRMGLALAERARKRGAEVTVICANVNLPAPAGVRRVDVESTVDLARACREQFPAHDLLLMAAAPADFTVADTSNEKLSRTGGEFTLTLVPTEDILAGLAANRIDGQTVVGFAAQHGGDAIGRARQKLERKGADMIVLNDVSDRTIGFDSDENAVTLVTGSGEREIPKAPKTEIADRILDRAVELRAG